MATLVLPFRVKKLIVSWSLYTHMEMDEGRIYATGGIEKGMSINISQGTQSRMPEQSAQSRDPSGSPAPALMLKAKCKSGRLIEGAWCNLVLGYACS